MNDKETLETFSNNLKKFTEGFYAAFFEELDNTYDTQVELKNANNARWKVVGMLDKHTRWYEDTIAVYNKEIQQCDPATEAEKIQSFTEKIRRAQAGLQEEQDKQNKVIHDLDEKIKEIRTKSAEKKELIKDKLREQFKEMDEYLEVEFVTLDGQKEVSREIDALIDRYKQELKYQYRQLAILQKKVENAEKEEKMDFRIKRAKAEKEVKRLEKLIKQLGDFQKDYDELKTLLANDKFFDNNTRIYDSFNTFANTFEAVDQTLERDSLTVNIKENSDGTFDVDINCGYRYMDPRKNFARADLTSANIKDLLERFAAELSKKTSFKYDDLINGNVVLKHNNEFIKKDGLNEICGAVDKIRTGQIEDLKAEEEKGKDIDKDKDENNDKDKDKDENNDKDKDKDENNDLDDDYNNDNRPVVYESNLPELDAHAMKVNGMRNARSKFYNGLRTCALLAATGLGFAGPALGIGMAGALVAAGVGIAGTGREAYVKFKENIKYGARIRQMKNLAKLMSAEAGADIVFDMDLEKRQAGFKLKGDDQFLTTDDLRDPNLFPEGMDDAILDVFENGGKLKRLGRKIKGVGTLNKYRGLGDGAKSLKQLRYKNFPVITFDNVSAAFNDFGGVKSRKELNNYQFDYNKILDARKNEQEAQNRVDENDNVESVDPLDLEGIENELEQGAQQTQQQQNPEQQNPAQGQQQQNPVQGQQQTQGNGGQNPVTNTELPPIELTDPGEIMVDQQKAQITDQASKIDEVMSQIQDSISTMDANDPNFKNKVCEDITSKLMACENELTIESRRQIVNMVHQSLKFEPEHMERFMLCIRDNRCRLDSEIMEDIAKITNPQFVDTEQRFGQAFASGVDAFIAQLKDEYEKGIRRYTSQDLDRLLVLEGGKELSKTNIDSLKNELEKIANNGRSL